MLESNVQQVLKAGNDQFTAKMFQEVVKAGYRSCALSPFSVLSPLAQLASASVGSTHDEILSAIGMPNDNVTIDTFTDINEIKRSGEGVELKQTNKVYVRTGYSLNQEFAKISKDVFDSEGQNIDFGNSEVAAKEINEWVEDYTNERIKHLVDPETLTEETAAVLVNAIYFKGKFKIPFPNYLTQNRNFIVDKGTLPVQMPMMQQCDQFKYAESEELDATILEMSYEGDETSLVIVLPNHNEGIDSLIEKFKDPAALSKGLQLLNYFEVDVVLPSIKIETKNDLKEVLQNMDIKKLFSSDPRLGKLIEGEANLYVSDNIQKTFIEINEEGAEAAAVNYDVCSSKHLEIQKINNFALEISTFATSCHRPRPQTFLAIHPFLFFFIEKDIVLFNGVFRA